MTIIEGKPPLTAKARIRNTWLRLIREWRIFALSMRIKAKTKPGSGVSPVVMFNASSRLGGFSQNAAFTLLATWGLQLANIPVVNFTCKSGMSRCVLGTDIDHTVNPPPCASCIAQSRRLQRSSNIYWFDPQTDQELKTSLDGLSVYQLGRFEWIVKNQQLGFNDSVVPLGQLVLPSLRWTLRRHDLMDDEPTRFILREFIISASQVAIAFDHCLEQINPSAVVVFNGTMFPEGTARWVAKKHGIRVITHEVGFQPFSAFFTDGQATAYPMEIPESFELSPSQNKRLDEYLSRRFKGEFTMAGIRFWPKISGLGEDFLKVASRFEQIVPVFTNVINDTSQVHASSVFSDMYNWLEGVVDVIRVHPETLFVIRAHPDEKRRGTRKHSRQPVSDWITQNEVDKLPNVIFIDSNEPISSYELIQISKFIFVYNSSIGLEASLLGIPVLCGGKARYTQYPTVFFPQTAEAYQAKAKELLTAETIRIPPEFLENARRILYWQLYRSALPLDRFVCAHPTPGYVQLKGFSWRDLLMENSQTIRVLVEGVLDGKPFIMPDDTH